MKEFTFAVTEQFNNYKACDYLSKQGVSDEIISKVKFGGVYLNGDICKNINDKVREGDIVKMVLPKDKPNPYITPKKTLLNVIYEDDFILAVVKDRGVLTHSSKYNKAISLEEMVCGYFLPEELTFRAINRLDKQTSGIVLIAKDMFTSCLLNKQMKEGKILKTYSAIVRGIPNKRNFIIEKPIDRESEGSIKRVCRADGKFAKTECKFIKAIDNERSLIEVILHTGRTHQIRVHLSSENLPLYADSLYGEAIKGQSYILHAKSLQFVHPITKEKMCLINSLKDFEF